MVKDTLLFALAYLFLLCNCAGLHQTENHVKYSFTNNFIPVYSVGIDAKDSYSGLFIASFDSDSSAKSAGMQTGDEIVSVDGKILSDKQFLKFMHLNRGEDILFKVRRKGQMLDYDIKPKLYFNSPPSAYKLYELLVLNGQKVNLAVIATDVRNNTGKRSYTWEESTRRRVQEAVQNSLLNNLDRQDNLSLVDSSRLDKILDEHKFNMTELASADAAAAIRKATGATHLLLATFARNPKKVKSGEVCEDTVTATLIEIETGKVLAVDQNTSACK